MAGALRSNAIDAFVVGTPQQRLKGRLCNRMFWAV